MVNLPPAEDKVIDPVSTLSDYINRTDPVRPHPDRPVFISLTAPFKGVGSDTIANILSEAINLAGLSGQGYSANLLGPQGQPEP